MRGVPTWQLVLSAAHDLDRRLGVFRLDELIAEVQRIDPQRQRGSISPVVQGMTVNASGGPPSPCGKPLRRVSHGVYELREDINAAPAVTADPTSMQSVPDLDRPLAGGGSRLAGGVDVREALRHLARDRPVFHSEADFQLAFGWCLQQLDPAMRVRLETRPQPGVRLDVHLTRPDTGLSTAVELKYPTRAWAGRVEGESFTLKDQGAQDLAGYDIVKDIWRVEQLVRQRLVNNGFVVVLTNDPSFWVPVTVHRDTNAAAFKTNEGIILTGRRAWGPRTGIGTMRGREAPLDLEGCYIMQWADYASLSSGERGSKFRSLVVAIGTDSAAEDATATDTGREEEHEVPPNVSGDHSQRRKHWWSR